MVHVVQKKAPLPLERLFLVETSSFSAHFLCNLKKNCKYFNCEYIYIFLFLWICYRSTARRFVSAGMSLELVAVISACVKLSFLFSVVNSMKTCLQCGERKNKKHGAELAWEWGGIISLFLMSIYYTTNV